MSSSFYVQIMPKYKCAICGWEGYPNKEDKEACPSCDAVGALKESDPFPSMTWTYSNFDVSEEPINYIYHDQKIRKADGGYITTLTFENQYGKLITIESINEKLEEALAEIIEIIAPEKEGKDVCEKLFPEAEDI